MNAKRKRFPRGVRKFIREEKARIRRVGLSLEEQKNIISELYKRFLKKYISDVSEKIVKVKLKKKAA